MFNLSKKNLFTGIFLISFIALVSAYFIEYILGHQPCNLCVYERIPYFLAILIVLINYKYNKLEKYLILLLAIIFFPPLNISQRKFMPAENPSEILLL